MLGGAGGRTRSVASLSSPQEFAGYWEYLLDGQSSPSRASVGRHRPDLEPRRIDRHRLAATSASTRAGEHVNMIVPIDLLKPVLDDLEIRPRQSRRGRARHVHRTEIDNRVVVVGIVGRAGGTRRLKAGDVISPSRARMFKQTGFYRKLWSLGPRVSTCRSPSIMKASPSMWC